MLIDFKVRKIKSQVCAYWHLMQHLVFQSFAADFHYTCFSGVNQLLVSNGNNS